jgi:DNA-binding MarR family transcriptional regulator
MLMDKNKEEVNTMSALRTGGLLIARIHQLAERVFSKMLRSSELCEINPGQGRILLVLWQQDGISIQELAVRTSLYKSTLTSMLERLELSGHICRTMDPQDRRRTLIYLTEPAKEDPQRYLYEGQITRMKNVFYKGFTEAEIDIFEDALQRILDNLTDVDKNNSL